MIGDIRQLARVNFEAPVVLTRHVLPHMMERGEGQIVQISSLAGAIPFPGLASYAGTKAGLTNFTESLRIELKGTGVGLTVVAPGIVETPCGGTVEAIDQQFFGESEAPAYEPSPGDKSLCSKISLPATSTTHSRWP